MIGTLGCLRTAVRLAGHRTTARRKPPCLSKQPAAGQARRFAAMSLRLAEKMDQGSPASDSKENDTSSTHIKQYFTIEDLDQEARAQFDRSSPEEQQEMRDALRTLSEADMRDSAEPISDEMEADIALQARELEREQPLRFGDYKLNKNQIGFWADGEDDEFTQVADEDDNFQNDDMTTPAHAQLDLHRDMREYQRRIAWDMPFLRKFAKPFTPPPLTAPLRFRYSTYMGEEHPAANKVVVELCVSDLDHQQDRQLTQIQRNKFIKLAGVRYNPSTDTIKMSSERFETQAQNKRYLGDLINKLLAEATDPTKDTFEDVPFDFRHHKPRKVFHFPDAWKLGGGDDARTGSENVRRLIDGRNKTMALSSPGSDVDAGDDVAEELDGESDVVDGDAIVRRYLGAVAVYQDRAKLQPGLARGMGENVGGGSSSISKRQALRR